MSDSRVEKLAVWFTRQHGTPDDHRELATQLVATVAAAGLLVIDPGDPEVEKRIAKVLDPHYEDLSAFDQRGIANRARAVISALRQR